MDSSPGLSELQRDVLREFFARERRFVLTGGGALIGYHLHHRRSDDLDLFGKPPVELADERRALDGAAAALGATVESLRTFPEFTRVLVRRGAESTIVDLAIDRAPDVDVPFDVEQGVRVQSRREVTANKLCALVGCSEIRDLIDLHALLRGDEDLERALRDAERKDAGVSAAVLAWTLDQVVIRPDAELPGVRAAELDRFRGDLVRRLRVIAHPNKG